jgi:hypothetical protein
MLRAYLFYLNRKPYQNVNRWFTTVVNQPQFKAVIGEFKLCEKMAEFDPKKFAEFQGTVFMKNSLSNFIVWFQKTVITCLYSKVAEMYCYPV